MTSDALCPRCGERVQPPGLLSSDWRCDRHGAISPLASITTMSQELLAQVVEEAGVPVWLPWPLPTAWVITGAVAAGREGGPSLATAMALSGPGARGGPGELVIVSEEPGVGLGAGYAGLPGPDAGAAVLSEPPSTRVMVANHETPLWEVPGPTDRSVYVGEADGRWLWAIAWPMEVGLVLHDSLILVDLRDPGHRLDLPLGAVSPRWRPGGASERDQ